VRVTIVVDSTSEACTHNCGTDWSSAEVLATVRQQVLASFGENVEVQYIDLAKVGKSNLGHKVRLLVAGLSLPVLLVNDRLRIAGEFDSRQLMHVIETELEVVSYERS
jgi:hypothetical protein